MKTSTRNILIVVGLLVAITIGLVGYGGYQIYSLFASFGEGRPIPDEIRETKITTGNGFLSRTEIFKLEEAGWTKIIRDSSAIADEKEREKVMTAQIARGIHNFSDVRVVNDKMIAVAEFGAFFFDLQGNLKKEVLFEPASERVKVGPFEQDMYTQDLSNLKVVPLEPGRIGFLSFGPVQGVRVFDETGKQIWSIGKQDLDLSTLAADREAEYEKSIHVLAATVGDLTGDGVSEYVVARKSDGIRAYDRSGKELWFLPADFPSNKLEIRDLNGDGTGELIEIGARIRDGKGKIIRETQGSDSDAFILVENKNREQEIQFASLYEGKLKYTAENGEEIFEADAPLAEVKAKEGEPVDGADPTENVAFPKAAWVSFRKKEAKYLAVIASFIGISRSNFYVYDRNGVLVYHELLPEEAETLAIVPSGDGVEKVIIGGKATIWRYTAN